MNLDKERKIAKIRLQEYLGVNDGWYGALSDALIRTIVDVIIDHRRTIENEL